jgi:acetyltransferase
MTGAAVVERALATDRLTLVDGRSVVVRPIRPQDDIAEQTFVRSLSPASRLLRFHIGIHELNPRILRAMTDVDHRNHVALVAQTLGDEPKIVADARYVLLDEPGEAEFAIAVADEWQGAGLGKQLLLRLMQHARRRGLRSLIGDVLHDNQRMFAMVHAMGGRMTMNPGDATLSQARLSL